MDPGIGAEFGMESRHQVAPLFHQHRIALIGRQHAGIRTHAANDGERSG